MGIKKCWDIYNKDTQVDDEHRWDLFVLYLICTQA